MSTLYLPDDPRTLVWRLVKARLRADAVLNQPDGLQLVFFEGSRDATKALADYPGPALVFLVTPGPMAWEDERSQAGAVVVDYAAKVPGLDDEDVLNLQGAIEGALYPADGGAFHQSLRDVEAQTGQADFTRPATLGPGQAGRDGMLAPSGQFTIKVNRPFPA